MQTNTNSVVQINTCQLHLVASSSLVSVSKRQTDGGERESDRQRETERERERDTHRERQRQRDLPELWSSLGSGTGGFS